MKQIIANWNLMRIIRLALGILIIVEGVRSQMTPITLMGAAFAALALFNIGCGPGGCAVPPQRPRPSDNYQSVEYEEVK